MKFALFTLGDDIHTMGLNNFAQLVKSLGHEVYSIQVCAEIRDIFAVRSMVDVIGISYRLAPDPELFLPLKQMRGRMILGATQQVADSVIGMSIFERIFIQDDEDDVVAWLNNESSLEVISSFPHVIGGERPLIRHHFGVPAKGIFPTVKGIERIARQHCLDVISLGPDQFAQEQFFAGGADLYKGSSGVPFRTREDLVQLYEATQTGNYPLIRSYSGTSHHIQYAEMLRDTIKNAWCATSLFWFNQRDKRGPSSLEASIREHLDLIKWCAENDTIVEANEPYHWMLRGSRPEVALAAAYIHAANSRALGVERYISTYMLETPSTLSIQEDLVRALSQFKIVEQFTDMRVFRQTRSGLASFPVDQIKARAHLARSVFYQMACTPHIVHVVGHVEAVHAATASDVIESCKIARDSIDAYRAGPVKFDVHPSDSLCQLAMEIVEQIDDIYDPECLALAVETGALS